MESVETARIQSLEIRVTGEGVFLEAEVTVPVLGRQRIRKRIEDSLVFSEPPKLYGITLVKSGKGLQAIVFHLMPVQHTSRREEAEKMPSWLEQYFPLKDNFERLMRDLPGMVERLMEWDVRRPSWVNLKRALLGLSRLVRQGEYVGHVREGRGTAHVFYDPLSGRYEAFFPHRTSLHRLTLTPYGPVGDKIPVGKALMTKVCRLVDEHAARRSRRAREEGRRRAVEEREVMREALF